MNEALKNRLQTYLYPKAQPCKFDNKTTCIEGICEECNLKPNDKKKEG